MSGDRELLRLAAKAAGIPQKWNDFWNGFYIQHPDGSWDSNSCWCPLIDDGDALRLAVALEIDVLQRRSDPEVWAQAPMRPTICEPIGNDRTAATRRAIARAAAAIRSGK